MPGPSKPDPRQGRIIVGLQTREATAMLRYSCSKRVMPVPTAYLNARRLDLSSLAGLAHGDPSSTHTLWLTAWCVPQDCAQHTVSCADICLPDAPELPLKGPGISDVLSICAGKQHIYCYLPGCEHQLSTYQHSTFYDLLGLVTANLNCVLRTCSVMRAFLDPSPTGNAVWRAVQDVP
jgi:hypothetical protein